jgi:hypothetical protein
MPNATWPDVERVKRLCPIEVAAEAAPRRDPRCSSAPSGSRVQGEAMHMATIDPFEDGAQETRQDFTANDFRITRALDSLLISAKSIAGDEVVAKDIAARVHTLRHLLRQVGHNV